MPEVLSGLFSKATLTKLGLDDNEIELYSGKMDKILEAATIVSYMLATSLWGTKKEVLSYIIKCFTTVWL